MVTTKNEAFEPTGVPGLDDVVRGGFPAERLILVQGAPGTGKTTLAMQYLLEGVRRGQRCLYVTLSESEDEILGVGRSHGWSLEGIDIYDLSIVESQLQQGQENTLFNPAEVELRETTQPVIDRIAQLKPQRVVFDSLSELRMLAADALRFRRRVLALKQHLANQGCTTLFLDDGTADPGGDLLLQSLAHGVLSLEQRAPNYGRERRQIQVQKMRGVSFAGGYHDVVIYRGGARVFPRLVAAEHDARQQTNDVVASGIAELDLMLGGGPTRGTSTLLVGPAGSGKSLLLGLYAHAAAKRGEKVGLFLFEESKALFLARCAGLGIDIAPYLANGLIAIRTVDPAELSPSEFTHAVVGAVADGAKIIGIDSLNGYLHAMPEERALTLQMHEMLSYLGSKNVTTFLVMVQHGLLEAQAPIDVSYVADNVVLLRFFEAFGHVRKALSVMKKRSGTHESTIRELRLSRGRVAIGPPLSDFQGILGGLPRFSGDSARLLEDDK